VKLRLLPLLSLTLLAGCAAGVPWMNPAVPKDRWAGDYSACRAYADRQVGWREEEGSSPFREFDRQQAKRQYDGMLGACMRERGYVPARKGS
jgi:hypothetical protein